MIEISLKSINKSFGSFDVLKDINFTINTKERVGIIGSNGCGKTTIFKLIAGIENIDAGILSVRKNSSIGLLEQIPKFSNETTVNSFLLSVFKDIFKLKEELLFLEKNLTDHNRSLLIKYSKVLEQFEHMGGYEIDDKVNKICSGLKIQDNFRKRFFSSLSGGEKTTVSIARLLLRQPDILLLDEPTNHLDLESVEWFENFIINYKGTAIIISHDRYFLDKVVNKIIEIEDSYSTVYKGNYSFYKKEKDKKILLDFEIFKNQQKKIKAMKEAIVRFKDWGSRADNPKMFKKAFQIEKRLEKMDVIKKPQVDKKINLKFNMTDRSGNDVLIFNEISKSFNLKIILGKLDFYIKYSEKICILGNNGTGKTTIFKLITNGLNPDSGIIKIGSRVKIGYLEQEVFFENNNMTVINYFRSFFPFDEGLSRNKLAQFLFFGDQVFKKLSFLSGGEKTRLKLCILINQDLNFLLLDEPTNHLDIESKEMLENALLNFNGTCLFISHDRYFINILAKKIFELRDSNINTFNGDYDYYQRKIKERNIIEDDIISHKKSKRIKKKRINKTNQKNKKEISNVENEIENLEIKIKEIEIEMNQNSSDYEKINDLYLIKKSLEEKHSYLISKWESLIS